MDKPVHILLVEDNEDDIIILKEVLTKHNIGQDLSTVRDGDEALDYIFKRGIYTGVTTPDLVLLDLNLPRKNGMEVLKEVRNNVAYKYLPIIVLSTSSSPDDITESYQKHANCFITKPSDITSLDNMVQEIKSFWLKTAQLPNQYV